MRAPRATAFPTRDASVGGVAATNQRAGSASTRKHKRPPATAAAARAPTTRRLSPSAPARHSAARTGQAPARFCSPTAGSCQEAESDRDGTNNCSLHSSVSLSPLSRARAFPQGPRAPGCERAMLTRAPAPGEFPQIPFTIHHAGLAKRRFIPVTPSMMCLCGRAATCAPTLSVHRLAPSLFTVFRLVIVSRPIY